MFCGDDVLYNDEQVALLKEASGKAVQNWRFRNVKSPAIRVLSAVAQDLLDAARRGIDAVRNKTEQARDQRPLTLSEQR